MKLQVYQSYWGMAGLPFNGDEEWSMEESEKFSNEPLIGKYLENGTLMVGDIRGVSLYQEMSWQDVYGDFINDDVSVLGGISECSGFLLYL